MNLKMFWVSLIALVGTSVSASEMKFGIDRLSEAPYAQLLKGKRLALLSHRASVDAFGRHAIDLLHGPHRVMKLFVPEHGLRSDLDDWVESGVDPVSGLPVISLYERQNREPRDSDLADVDAVVIDLQDVGVRYYTYSSTVAAVLKKCGEKGVEVILLDRPNPIGGEVVEGFVLKPVDAGFFTSYHTVSTRHGMTLGELARMYNEELGFRARLTVIPVQGWDRARTVLDWDRPWVPASPALESGDQTLLYALWGALEGATLAVGRGLTNENAFRRIGAPWITASSAAELARELNALGFSGVEFKPIEWKVTRATHQGKLVRGVELVALDYANLPRSDEFVVKVTQVLKRRYSTELTFNNQAYRSYGSADVLQGILAQVPFAELVARDAAAFSKFSDRRSRFLLY